MAKKKSKQKKAKANQQRHAEPVVASPDVSKTVDNLVEEPTEQQDQTSCDIDDVKEDEEYVENTETSTIMSEGPIGESTKGEPNSAEVVGDVTATILEKVDDEVDDEEKIPDEEAFEAIERSIEDYRKSDEAKHGEDDIPDAIPNPNDLSSSVNASENLDPSIFEDSVKTLELATDCAAEPSSMDDISVEKMGNDESADKTPAVEDNKARQDDVITHPQDQDEEIKDEQHIEPHEEVPSNISQHSTTDAKVAEDLLGAEPQTASIQHKQCPLQLKTISTGPYMIHTLLESIDLYDPEIPDSNVSTITCIQNYDMNIYIGTSIGEILRFQIDDTTSKYTLASRLFFHHTRRSPITKILPLSSISKALILSGGLVSCFNLPDLTPSGIGRIKDVNDITLDFDNIAKNDSFGVHVMVLAQKQIRIINVTNDALRLVKDIGLSGICKGLRRGKFAVVASDKMYDLIDLENFGKIPLFPISTSAQTGDEDAMKLEPLIVPVGKDEFLLTCGTSNEEPAMGIIINNNGDVSRGTLSFETYPRSVEIDGDFVTFGFENEIVIYSVETQTELQRIEFESSELSHQVHVGNLCNYVDVNDDDLVELIKLVPLISDQDNHQRLTTEEKFARNVSRVKARIYYQNVNTVNLLKPIPKLLKLNQVNDTKVLLEDFNSIQMINNSNELNFVELEYLNLLITITSLDKDQFDEPVWESLVNGTIDPRIFCQIMGYKIFGDDIWIFNGIAKRLENLKNKRVKSTKLQQFFRKFLDNWIMKKSVDVNMNDAKDSNILKTLELIKLEILTNAQEQLHLSEFINNSNVSDYEEASKFLSNSPLAIADIHLKKHEFKEAVALLRSTYETTHQSDILSQITDIIYHHCDQFSDDYIYDFGIWLVHRNSQLGLNFLQNKRINRNGLKNNDFHQIMSKIDENSVKFSYLENLLINLNSEKMKGTLVKNLKKWELKKMDIRLKNYQKR